MTFDKETDQNLSVAFTKRFYVSETDISQAFDADSPHLPWDHPFYDIARHQIIEVAGELRCTVAGLQHNILGTSITNLMSNYCISLFYYFEFNILSYIKVKVLFLNVNLRASMCNMKYI